VGKILTSFFLLGQLVASLLFANEQLEPMVVSALRLETETKNLPARVKVIDKADIQQSGAAGLVELLRREANLQIRSTSGNHSRSVVSLGGFGDNAEQRTLVLVDGHRLNAFDLSHINWHSIPLAMVESIEIIRGAQSGTYGNHAVGGVIKINTRVPQEGKSSLLEVSGGSYDSMNTRGVYSQQVHGVGLTAFGEHDQSNGYRDNGDYKTHSGGVRVDWGYETDLKAYLFSSFSDTEFGLPGDLNASTLSRNRKFSNNPADRGREKSFIWRSGLSVQLNDAWVLEKRIGYDERRVNANMPSQGGYLATSDYDTLTFSPTLQFNSDDVNFLVGFDYFDGGMNRNGVYNNNDLNSSNDIDASGVHEREAIAHFLSGRYSISESWDWIGNLRFQKNKSSLLISGTRLNEIKDIDWAGGVGLIRKFGSTNRVYSTLRSFFRYPSTDELVAYEPPYYLPANHVNLVPEEGYELEFGLDWSWSKFCLDARFFQQWMEHEIISNGSSNFNLDDTERVGLDFSLTWDITEMVSSGLTYGYVRSKISEGTFKNSRVPLVSESMSRLFIEIRPYDSLLVHFGGTYVGESFEGNDLYNSGKKLPDYWIYDLTMNYQFSEHATFFGGVENLFDQDYISTAYQSAFGNPTAYYPGQGRRVTVGLRYSF